MPSLLASLHPSSVKNFLVYKCKQCNSELTLGDATRRGYATAFYLCVVNIDVFQKKGDINKPLYACFSHTIAARKYPGPRL